MATIRVHCPSCNSQLEIDSVYVGQEVECGNCFQTFVANNPKPNIPGASFGESVWSELDDKPSRRSTRRRSDDDDEDDRRRSRRRRDDYDDDDDYYSPPSRHNAGNGLAVTSLVLGISSVVLACCCGL